MNILNFLAIKTGVAHSFPASKHERICPGTRKKDICTPTYLYDNPCFRILFKLFTQKAGTPSYRKGDWIDV